MKKKQIVSTVLCSVFLFGGVAMLVLGAVMLDNGYLCENDTNMVMPPSPPMEQPPPPSPSLPPLTHHRSLKLVSHFAYRRNSNGVYMDDCKVKSMILITMGSVVSFFSFFFVLCVCLRLAT